MKNKGFSLIALLAVIAILALLAVIIVPKLMKVEKETPDNKENGGNEVIDINARAIMFENDVIAIYKTMEKALQEYELNLPEGREDEYAKYFEKGSEFIEEQKPHEKYTDYLYFEKECPTEFWSSSKTNCQYYYEPKYGIGTLLVSVDIPENLQSYYAEKDNINIYNIELEFPICQAIYAPSWQDLGYDSSVTGFMFHKCGSK